jgi:hypothetical protein
MKKSDKILYDLLKKNMQIIEDDTFTERIIKIHLSRQKKPVHKPFLNFNLLIIGISLVIISIGLSLSSITNTILIKDFNFTEQHSWILLSISLIFLISVWIMNFIEPKTTFVNKN